MSENACEPYEDVCALDGCEERTQNDCCDCCCEFDDEHGTHVSCDPPTGWSTLTVCRPGALAIRLPFCSDEHLQAGMAQPLPEPQPRPEPPNLSNSWIDVLAIAFFVTLLGLFCVGVWQGASTVVGWVF